jgi:hypothetical protein
MKHLLLTSMIACAVALIAPSMPTQANDAHHPEKAAKAKTGVGSKAKPAKKTPVKSNRAGASARNG